MILFTHRASYIKVFQSHMNPRLSVKDIGRIRELSAIWTMQFIGRNWSCYTDLLNDSEKRQIIGLLDNLNSVTGRDPISCADRWNEIIGLTEGAIT